MSILYTDLVILCRASSKITEVRDIHYLCVGDVWSRARSLVGGQPVGVVPPEGSGFS